MKNLHIIIVTLLALAPFHHAWLQQQRHHSMACRSTLPSPFTQLFSTPRQPRRELQKRRRRKEKQEQNRVVFQSDDTVWDSGEVRPLVKESAKEKGLDYWIPQDDLVKYQQIEEAKRLRDPGQVSNEKLMTEVLSPYKQNWIGVISVAIVAIAALIKNFPELLLSPTISIPDL
ncbi:hypothetical protein MPSEU_000632200 [Mayamaea pseudoterrestris]|nr:hypothetical protein MPSEU_000632200 [Mayamaea pseudoterrestris]